MKSIARITVVVLAFTGVSIGNSTVATAAKIGASCKSINQKSWDGNKPIICKKNSKGKLTWSAFKVASESSSSYKISISLVKFYDTLRKDNPTAVNFCAAGGIKYPDVVPTTTIEIRDGSGNLIATSSLGTPLVEDIVNPNSGLTMGNCVYNPSVSVKKSDFYQVKIGTRYTNSFSFNDLVSKGWKVELSIGQY